MRVKQWLVLVYRIPSEPASKRVATWWDFKGTGALLWNASRTVVLGLSSSTSQRCAMVSSWMNSTLSL